MSSFALLVVDLLVASVQIVHKDYHSQNQGTSEKYNIYIHISFILQFLFTKIAASGD
jgi:hypothetical protein